MDQNNISSGNLVHSVLHHFHSHLTFRNTYTELARIVLILRTSDVTDSVREKWKVFQLRGCRTGNRKQGRLCVIRPMALNISVNVHTYTDDDVSRFPPLLIPLFLSHCVYSYLQTWSRLIKNIFSLMFLNLWHGDKFYFQIFKVSTRCRRILLL